MSIEILAVMVGMHPRAIARIERGQDVPPHDMQDRLFKCLEVPDKNKHADTPFVVNDT